MSGHTPGPWVWGEYMGTPILKADDKIILDGWDEGGIKDFDNPADAHLIAAAPDMLAAIRLALAIGLDGSEGARRDIRENVFPVLRAAIAKAEGNIP